MTDDDAGLAPAPERAALSVDRLYRSCDPDTFDFDSTEDLAPLDDHLGQERAAAALELGLLIPHDGYNIFLLGSAGVGKEALLRKLLERENTPARAEVRDWCYVNNFDAPDKPLALSLPRGMARRLRDDMAHAVAELLGLLPSTFQGEEYQLKVQALGEQYQAREREAFEALSERARARQVALIQTPSGYTLAPMRDDEIISPKDFDALPDEERTGIIAVIEEFKGELKSIVRQLPGWKKESRDQFQALNREFCHLAIDPVVDALRQRWAAQSQVLDYLAAVHRNLLEDAEAFSRGSEESPIPVNPRDRVREFPQYAVNVLVDNQDVPAAPVVHEDSPGFANLVGRVEHVVQMGALVTDFTLIKPGALHRANGGYLVLEADKLLTNVYAWTALKQALKGREVRIQSLEQIFSLASTVQLQPAPMPLDVKVVLTGDRYIYYLLQEYDPEFGMLFKIAADMSEDVPRSAASTALFARMIRTLQLREQLLPLDRGGVARVIEFASRSALDSEKLSLHQGRLSDLLTESDFRARRAGARMISAEHVSDTIAAAVQRLDQFRERSHESILRGITLIETTGSAIGQVNGLAVYVLGDYAFGKPTRITATARLGGGKVLDIERESALGGPIHSKAMLIITALLADRYAREQPLPLSASVVFEQSYGGIEGDSASVAELVALVSAIGDIPVRQELAVTGSLNQRGRVQAIGGVNQKIEGFFDICAARGLTGSQGVVIPRANEIHLMLRQDVLDAVRDGTFRIHGVDDVDEALELLTGCGVAAIDNRVRARVQTLQELSRRFADKAENNHRG